MAGPVEHNSRVQIRHPRRPAHTPAACAAKQPSREVTPQFPPFLQAVAQGRVWSGRQALEHGLVDVLGGIGRALQLAKLAADIPLAQNVPVIEFSRAKVGR